MITLTRLNSEAVTVNVDLIVLMERSPETTLTLMNGDRVKVREGVEAVIRMVGEWKRALLAGPPVGDGSGGDA